MLFNLFFTSIPVITLATMDQDVPDYVSLVIPQLYRAGINYNERATILKFLFYMADGLYQSAISFFFPWLLFRTGSVATHNGLGIGQIFSVGTFCIHIAIISCNLYIILKQRRWDPITVSLNFLSDLLLFIWVSGWSSSHFSNNFYKIGLRNYESASFWACLFIGVLACVIPGFALDLFRINYFPSDTDKVREMLKINFFEQRDAGHVEKQLEIAKRIGNNSASGAGNDAETSKEVETPNMQQGTSESNEYDKSSDFSFQRV